MAAIAILFHKRTRDPASFTVHYLADFWRAAGHQVVYLFGTSRYVPADILLIHVDLSVVPPIYLDFADRYPVVINRNLIDIRKSQISKSLLALDDSWHGAVIVKTNLNCGGVPERNLASAPEGLFGSAVRRVRRILGSAAPGSPSLSYSVFSSISDIPNALATRRDVVIEKFHPEVEDGLYRVRTHLVLGDRWTSTRHTSREPIVKARNSVFTENIPPHPIVHEWRRDMNVDYGKIDYVVVDDEPFLLDVNKTIGVGARTNASESVRTRRRHLAEGINFFLDQRLRGYLDR